MLTQNCRRRLALQCCGSSLFLKNRFGAGYQLICTRAIGAPASGSTGTVVEELLREFVSDAKLLTDVGAEMTFQLPAEESAAFPPMLRRLDERMGSLGIEHYGVSQVTMEEVFLKVGQSVAGSSSGIGHSAGGESIESGVTIDGGAIGNIIEMSPLQVFARHFEALLKKRMRYGKRDKCTLFCSTVMPAMLLCFCLYLLDGARDTSMPEVALDSTQFSEYGDRPDLTYNRTEGRLQQSVWGADMEAHAVSLDAPPAEFFGTRYTDGLKCTCEEPNVPSTLSAVMSIQGTALPFTCTAGTSWYSNSEDDDGQGRRQLRGGRGGGGSRGPPYRGKHSRHHAALCIRTILFGAVHPLWSNVLPASRCALVCRRTRW
eukprot:SAG11_NODE_1058_length_6003_cov_1.474424_5_plen_373_part_00